MIKPLFSSLGLAFVVVLGLVASGCGSSGGSTGDTCCVCGNPDPICGRGCATLSCPQGYFCENDQCTNQCNAEASCSGGLVCNASGRCVDPTMNGGPCGREPPHEDCGLACDPAFGCPQQFFYCENGVCGSDCDATDGCLAGEMCASNGRCVPFEPPRDMPIVDVPTGESCPSVNVTADAITPTVILVVDWSGSMNASFGTNSDRWHSVYDVLVDPTTGVVSNLADRVIFGATLYSSSNNLPGDDADDPGIVPCPLTVGGMGFPARSDCLCLRQVAPALNNATAIRNAIPINRGNVNSVILEDTPTPDTIHALTDQYVSLDSAENPVIFIVATDGEPDTCANGDPSTSQLQGAANTTSVNEAERAFGMGIETYVIFVGNATGTAANHVQEMSNVGVGLARNGSGGDAMVFPGDSPTALRTALESIIQSQLSCDLDLSRTLTSPSAACNGTVRLGTDVLTCQGTNCSASDGYCAVDNDTIRLLGTDCDRFRTTNGLELTGVFSCGAIVVE